MFVTLLAEAKYWVDWVLTISRPGFCGGLGALRRQDARPSQPLGCGWGYLYPVSLCVGASLCGYWFFRGLSFLWSSYYSQPLISARSPVSCEVWLSLHRHRLSSCLRNAPRPPQNPGRLIVSTLSTKYFVVSCATRYWYFKDCTKPR